MVRLEEVEGRLCIVARSENAERYTTLPPDADDQLVDQMLSNTIRRERDRLLAECDYIMMADYPASEPERAAWATYRQALRDVPKQAGFPRDVAWPEIQSF